MPNHLTPAEQARLDEIEAGLSALAEQAKPLKAEKQAILGRARFRRHYAAKTASSQS
jgi:hypothetical protein